jgi:hypothetical protein
MINIVTYYDDLKFIKEVIDENLLDKAIEFIKANIAIEEVYDRDPIVNWVKENEAPGDVFSDSELKDWALDNDFVAKEE